MKHILTVLMFVVLLSPLMSHASPLTEEQTTLIREQIASLERQVAQLQAILQSMINELDIEPSQELEVPPAEETTIPPATQKEYKFTVPSWIFGK